MEWAPTNPENPVAIMLLGGVVFSVVVGGVIGLLLWVSRPEATRGHPVGLVLRWIGILVGLFVLRLVFSVPWNWFWFGWN